MDPIKVAGIRDWERPQAVKEVQSFLGFTNFYRKFIWDYSQLTWPMVDLTRKTVSWSWGKAQEDSFKALKEAICSNPVLHFPVDNALYQVEANSSGFATGTILSQLQEGSWVPIAFLSKGLNETERNYDIHDKEMLAIMRSLKEWRHYLLGPQFEIWSDHKNLEYFMTSKTLNRRQARWSIELADYDFLLVHKPGKSHQKLDLLSR